MFNIEDFIKAKHYGKRAIVAILAGTMSVSSLTAPLSVYAEEVAAEAAAQESIASTAPSATAATGTNVVSTYTEAPAQTVVATPVVPTTSTSTSSSSTGTSSSAGANSSSASSSASTGTATTPTTTPTTPSTSGSTTTPVTPTTPSNSDASNNNGGSNTGAGDGTTDKGTTDNGDGNNAGTDDAKKDDSNNGSDSNASTDDAKKDDSSSTNDGKKDDSSTADDSKKDDSNTTKKDDSNTGDTKKDDSSNNSSSNNSSSNSSNSSASSNNTAAPTNNGKVYNSGTNTSSATKSNSTYTGTKSSEAENYGSYSYSKQNYVAHHYTQDLTTEMFIASIGEEARQIAQQNDLYASVMIAQAILESGSGGSTLSRAPYNNLFGIKGTWYSEDGQGHTADFATQEDDGTGAHYTINAGFRAYNTTADSLQDYANLLSKDMRYFYSGALKSHTESFSDAAFFLQGRYATDTTYASQLLDLIETYDLTRYDEALDYTIDGTIADETAEGGVRSITMDDYVKLESLATAQLGVTYVWGASDPEVGFDCSGLTSWVYKQVFGMDITRTSYTQQYQGVEVDFDDLRLGDLLFFEDGGDVHHVAMYLGDGYYIHAPKPGDQVKITAMDSYTPSFAKRVLAFDDSTAEAKNAAEDLMDGEPVTAIDTTAAAEAAPEEAPDTTEASVRKAKTRIQMKSTTTFRI